MSDRGSTPSNPPTLADQGVGATQVIDLADIDLSGVLPPSEEKRVVPPPLPPEELARASHLPSAPPPSFQPSQAPQAAGRGAGFYVAILLACLVVFVGAGALIARSMRGAPPVSAAPAVAAPTANGQPAAARVITIAPVEMTDDVDAGKKK